jgi:hypothetical protein
MIALPRSTYSIGLRLGMRGQVVKSDIQPIIHLGNNRGSASLNEERMRMRPKSVHEISQGCVGRHCIIANLH